MEMFINYISRKDCYDMIPIGAATGQLWTLYLVQCKYKQMVCVWTRYMAAPSVDSGFTFGQDGSRTGWCLLRLLVDVTNGVIRMKRWSFIMCPSSPWLV